WRPCMLWLRWCPVTVLWSGNLISTAPFLARLVAVTKLWRRNSLWAVGRTETRVAKKCGEMGVRAISAEGSISPKKGTSHFDHVAGWASIHMVKAIRRRGRREDRDHRGRGDPRDGTHLDARGLGAPGCRDGGHRDRRDDPGQGRASGSGGDGYTAGPPRQW